MTAELLLLHAALGLYLAATVGSLVGVAVQGGLPRVLVPRLLASGLAVHVLAVVIRSAAVGHLAITTFDEALSCLAMLLVAVFLVVQVRRPLVALGAVVSPLAFALTLAGVAIYRGAEPLPPEFESVWRPVHILFAFLGDAVFGLAFSASLLYLVQERRLKGRRGRGFLRALPSLEALDRLNHSCLVWGLVLLTLGIVSGVVWAHSAWSPAWASDLKLLLSVVTWLIYMVLLQGRITAGWRGRRAATLTIAGFAVIVLSFVGVNLLRIGHHGEF